MVSQNRMSPLGALVIGFFAVGGLCIACATFVVLYGMRVVDRQAGWVLKSVTGVVDGTIEALPDLLAALPPGIAELLNDRRAPEYARTIDTKVDFVVERDSGLLRPVLTISNKGEEVVSLLTVRVAGLNRKGVPVREWTEVVATPLAVSNEWRGPLMPGATRHVLLSVGRRAVSEVNSDDLAGAIEISDVRVWQPMDRN